MSNRKGVSRRRAIGFVASAVLAPAVSFGAEVAQGTTYPQRVVKIVVPFAPGGPSDLVGRLLATLLQDSFGQPFVVENRGGAGGNIGTALVGKAAPDGYTLLVVGTSQFTINPWLYKSLAFDFQKDFTPIAQLAVAPAVFTVHPSSGIKTIQDFIARAKADPNKLNVGNPGAGSPPHIASEQLMVDGGIKFVNVPYSGASLAVQALLGQSIDAASTAVPPVQGLIEAGRLTGLAATGTSRWPGLPNVPTMVEAGFPDFAVESIFALLAPAGTPGEIVQRLARETATVFGRPGARERALATGFEARVTGPEQLRARIANEAPKFKALIEKAGITPQ